MTLSRSGSVAVSWGGTVWRRLELAEAAVRWCPAGTGPPRDIDRRQLSDVLRRGRVCGQNVSPRPSTAVPAAAQKLPRSPASRLWLRGPGTWPALAPPPAGRGWRGRHRDEHLWLRERPPRRSQAQLTAPLCSCDKDTSAVAWQRQALCPSHPCLYTIGGIRRSSDATRPLLFNQLLWRQCLCVVMH